MLPSLVGALPRVARPIRGSLALSRAACPHGIVMYAQRARCGQSVKVSAGTGEWHERLWAQIAQAWTKTSKALYVQQPVAVQNFAVWFQEYTSNDCQLDRQNSTLGLCCFHHGFGQSPCPSRSACCNQDSIT